MIRKMFEQYSRVVPNGLKRERLYKKYRSKVAAQILFVVFSRDGNDRIINMILSDKRGEPRPVFMPL